MEHALASACAVPAPILEASPAARQSTARRARAQSLWRVRWPGLFASLPGTAVGAAKQSSFCHPFVAARLPRAASSGQQQVWICDAQRQQTCSSWQLPCGMHRVTRPAAPHTDPGLTHLDIIIGCSELHVALLDDVAARGWMRLVERRRAGRQPGGKPRQGERGRSWERCTARQ